MQLTNGHKLQNGAYRYRLFGLSGAAVAFVLIFFLFLRHNTKQESTTVAGNNESTAVVEEVESEMNPQGVIINGVRWATSNVAAPGTFAAKPEDAGMFYQWNRKTAWPATGSVSNWNSSMPISAVWEKADDPSPAGWRVPIFNEIKKLFDTGKVSNEWTTLNGVAGRKFIDKATGNSIFLPAAGYRYYSDGELDGVGSDGYYWSSTQGDSGYAYYLTFSSGYADWSTNYRKLGFSVRPVAEN